MQLRFPTNFMSWDSMKILAAHPLVIAEIKTCAPRSATLDQFMRDLASLMREATSQLEDRVDQIFNAANNYRATDCGEWWRFKIATRRAYSAAGNIPCGMYNRKASRVDYNSALPKLKGSRRTCL